MRTVASRFVHVRSRSLDRLEDREAAVERLRGQQDDEDQALQHEHGRVGQIHAPLDQAAGGDEAAEQYRDGHDDQRIMARQERDENAGEAIAGRQRGVGAALDRRHFEEAGEPGAAAGDHRAADDQLADRQALRERGAEIAARHPRREAEGRARHQDIERDGEHDADGEAPMHVGAGDFADHIGVADRLGRGLVGVARVAQHAFDEEVHDGDADIGQQQRRNGLVDAARVAQIAGDADPDRADRDRRRRP